MNILLGDLSHHVQANAHNLYVPLNVGYLASYIKSKFAGQIKLAITKSPIDFLQQMIFGRPKVVGLSLYYWNASLVKVITQRIKMINKDTIIVVGGPSIDTDIEAQNSIFDRYPDIDVIIPNEGEQGFAMVVEAVLGGNKLENIPGATVRGGKPGARIGLSTPLEKVPSPYLSGLMDNFLGGLYKPMIQTSRLCPYTCAFCVSGKDRGKLRAFDVDTVREELTYIAKRFKGHKDALLYLTDENFGILERDLTVADAILDIKSKYGYPNRVFYYNDKRFTQISRNLHEKLGEMCWHGVTLSLQSENPETLKAINRRNLTDEQLQSALAWAKGLGLKTSTELIFGLPGETLQTFCQLVDKCARFGFDVINVYHLILFDGIEMNRRAYREKYRLETKTISRLKVLFDREPIDENDEIVVASDTFSVEDTMKINQLISALQKIYVLGEGKEAAMQHVAAGGSLSEYILGRTVPAEITLQRLPTLN